MFTKGFDKYSCIGDTIACSIDGFDVTARIEFDDQWDGPDERDDSFWPSRDDYVEPENFEREQTRAEQVMKAWKNDEWFYCGVVLSVSRNGVVLDEYAASLWSIECNYPDTDNSYLLEVANELLPEALAAARAKLTALCR